LQQECYKRIPEGLRKGLEFGLGDIDVKAIRSVAAALAAAWITFVVWGWERAVKTKVTRLTIMLQFREFGEGRKFRTNHCHRGLGTE
jgi:hypothetical protein